MEKKTFYGINYPSYAESPCSPKIPKGFEGLIIDGPSKINFLKKRIIPICGSYRLSYQFLKELNDNPIEITVLTFVDKETSKPYSFNLIPDKEPLNVEKEPTRNGDVRNILIPKTNEAIDMQVIENYFISLYFNVNVIDFIPNLPTDNRFFIVYATLQKYKSNPIEIQIVE